MVVKSTKCAFSISISISQRCCGANNNNCIFQLFQYLFVGQTRHKSSLSVAVHTTKNIETAEIQSYYDLIRKGYYDNV